MVLAAPMPSASETIDVTAKSGLRTSWRADWRRSVGKAMGH